MTTALTFDQQNNPQFNLGLRTNTGPAQRSGMANLLTAIQNANQMNPAANIQPLAQPMAQPMAQGQGPSFRFQDLNRAFQLDPRNTLSNVLLQQGMRGGPVRTPLEGFGRLSQSLVGAMLQKRALDRLEGQETTRQSNIQAQQDAITATLPANLQSMFTGPATAESLASAQQLNLQKELAPTSEFAIQETPQGSVFGVRETDAFGNVTFKPSGQQTDRAPVKGPDQFRPLTMAEIENAKKPVADGGLGLKDADLVGAQFNETQNRIVFKSKGQTINVDATTGLPPTEEQKEFGKTIVKRVNDTFLKPAAEAGTTIQALNQALNLMNQSFEQGDEALTGFGIEFLTDVQAGLATISNLLGFDVSELGVDVELIKDRQTLRAELNKLVLGQTQKLKGSLSNRELDFSAKATANMGNTPEANFLILTVQKMAAQKMQLAADAASDWFSSNGTYGKGKGADGKEYSSFEKYWRKVSQEDEFIGPQLINELNSAKQIEAYLDIKGVKKDANGAYTDDALSKLTPEELDAIKAKLGSFNQ
jgi:LysM repeat protein